MVTDIRGWAEVRYEHRDRVWWRALLNVGEFVGPHYDCFASLFGVRNEVGFVPVAADRGLPDDVSDVVERRYPHGSRGEESNYPSAESPYYHGETHVSLAELEAVDWDASPRIDDPRTLTTSQWRRVTRIDKYDERGTLVASDVDLSDGGDLSPEQVAYLRESWELEADGYWYKARTISREDALSPGMTRVLRYLTEYEDTTYRDADEIRLVVWFEG